MVSMEMPKYKCHKEVWALKIKFLTMDCDGDDEWDGSYLMGPEENGYGVIKLPASFCGKHKPEVGGYYVVYEDGYASYSPAAAFESGYALIS